jgi:hypothetical protein
MNLASWTETARKTRPRCYHCIRFEPAAPPIGVVPRHHYPHFSILVFARYLWRQKDSNE